MEKTFFNTESLENFTLQTTGLQDISLLDRNDIYHWFHATLFQDAASSAAVKLTLIYPCTDTHIRKYSAQQPHMVVETPEIYEKYIKKYIEEKIGSERLNWVSNILEHKAEADRIILEDHDPLDGFILLPDLSGFLIFSWLRKHSTNGCYVNQEMGPCHTYINVPHGCRPP